MVNKLYSMNDYSTVSTVTSGNGILHSETEPARVMANGDAMWYYEGMKHRKNGPAYTSIIDDYCEYVWMNVHITNQKEWQRLSGMNDEDTLAMMLKYGGFNTKWTRHGNGT